MKTFLLLIARKGTCRGSEHNLGSYVFPPCGFQRLNSGFHKGSKCLCPLSRLAAPHFFGACGGEARSLVTWSSMGRLGCLASEPLGSTSLPALRSLTTQIESTSLPKDWATWSQQLGRGGGDAAAKANLAYISPALPSSSTPQED